MKDQQPLNESAIAALAEALAPVDLPPERNARLRAGLLDAVRARSTSQNEADVAFVTVRPGEGQWQALAAGIDMKFLHDHGDAQSFLLRLAPGAKLPVHGHASDELCVVLEGSVTLDAVEVGAGTFHLALAGSEHHVVSTSGGCVLFLRADLDQALRAA